ncbi:N-6 DNA methylase [Rhizobium leguminosarum]|uniref:N-6 DNA methylase n=1 Tax=Rhizobium leguminosarum TaxID=384 RepID=UPI003F9BCADF
MIGFTIPTMYVPAYDILLRNLPIRDIDARINRGTRYELNILSISAQTRKQLGKFYTPEAEAASFAKWLIRTGTERLLEPSVGDGALLFAALDRAESLAGCLDILGCDVDLDTIRNLRTQLTGKVELVGASFFDLDPEVVSPVDVVFANPPFTRNHQISREERTSLRSRFPVKGPAGLWVYFVFHAMRFLRPGGRMAFVVPAAASFTDYASHLMEAVRAEFSAVSLHELPKTPNWVGGAEERGALLLCDCYLGKPSRGIERAFWSYDYDAPVTRVSSLPVACTRLGDAAYKLEDIAEIQIGSVTGANRVFLLNSDEMSEFGLSGESVIPTVSRARQVVGLTIEKIDLERLSELGQKTWLLKPSDLGEKGSAVRRRLALLGPSVRRGTAWFSKRSPWWKVGTVECDAVFTYMNDFGPKLALVETGITCSNTLHAVRFRDQSNDATKAAAALTVLSTYGQLIAETIGRKYGGGVLKFELKETSQLPVLPASTDVRDALKLADEALRRGDKEKGRQIADASLLPFVLGDKWANAVQEMSKVLNELQGVRRGMGRGV